MSDQVESVEKVPAGSPVETRGNDPAGAGGIGLWWLLPAALLVLMAVAYSLRWARSAAQTQLTQRPTKANAGAKRPDAWAEAGRRKQLEEHPDTPRERGMFDDNDDEDNPDRPMWKDDPRGER